MNCRSQMKLRNRVSLLWNCAITGIVEELHFFLIINKQHESSYIWNDYRQ